MAVWSELGRGLRIRYCETRMFQSRDGKLTSNHLKDAAQSLTRTHAFGAAPKSRPAKETALHRAVGVLEDVHTQLDRTGRGRRYGRI